MAQATECVRVARTHPILVVIHDERLVDRLFVPFRVSLLYLALLFTLLLVLCPEPLLPCGQRQGKHYTCASAN